jgi:hypothetical protein
MEGVEFNDKRLLAKVAKSKVVEKKTSQASRGQ